MSITEAQQEALAQLQAITNSADVDRDRAILESVNWDVQRAIARIFDGDDQPPPPTQSQGASSSRAPAPPTRPFEPMDVDDSAQGDPVPARRPDPPSPLYPLVTRLFGILSYPFTVSVGILAGVLQFLFRVLRVPFPRFSGITPRAPPSLRRPPRGGNPADAAERWVRELEDFTGAMTVTRAAVVAADSTSDPGLRHRKVDGQARILPDFWIGDYESALKTAQREARILCVILVSEEHDDTPEFKRAVLTDPDFVRDLNDNNMIVWGGDVRDREAYQTAQRLAATGYPFVAFVSLHPRTGQRSTSASTGATLTVCSRHQGNPTTHTSAQTLHTHITNTLLPRVNPTLTRVRNEMRMREQERELRAEQDRAFERARKLDEEREFARRAAERQAQEEKEAQRRAAEAERMKEVNKETWRRFKKVNLPSEPKFGGVRVGVRLPNGTRVIRMFSPSDPVEALYTFVDVQFLPSNSGSTSPPTPAAAPAGYSHSFEFTLATAYPRKEVPLVEGKTLGQMEGLKGGANLVVEAKAGSRLGDQAASDEDSDLEDEDED